MSENELVVFNEAELAALAAELGGEQSSGDYLPNLRAQYSDEIEVNGVKKEVKPGLFTISGEEIPSFAKVATIRVLSQHFQYREWDKEAEKVSNKSIFITDFREEAIDEKGTLRAGKPPSKELKDNKALREMYKNINVFRVLHVLVDYEGVDADGNPVSVKNKLAVWNGKGANFSPFEEEYSRVRPKGSRIWDYPIKVSNKKEKNGTTTYWVTHFEPDFSVKLPLTNDVYETLKAIKTRVDAQNDEISKKHYNAIRGRQDDLADVEAMKTINASARSLDDDFANEITDFTVPFEDDIPF